MKRYVFLILISIFNIYCVKLDNIEKNLEQDIQEVVEKIKINVESDEELENIQKSSLAQKVQKLHKERQRKNYDFADYQIPVERISIACNKYGYPLLEALEQLIKEQYFSSKDKVIVTNVTEKQGGMNSEQIFLVTVKYKVINNDGKIEQHEKKAFVLKISSLKAEVENLINLQKSVIGRVGIQARYAQTNLPVKKNDLPIICWIEKIFIYQPFIGKEKYIEVLHAAQGVEVFNILTLNDWDLKLNCLYSVGRALGLFQQLFMSYSDWTTVCHGDFHAGNILFDSKSSRVYFVDNGTMSFNCSFYSDFSNFANSLVYFDMQYPDYPYNYLYFCQGYLDSFPSSKQAYLAQKIQNETNVIFRAPLFKEKLLENIKVFFNYYLTKA